MPRHLWPIGLILVYTASVSLSFRYCSRHSRHTRRCTTPVFVGSATSHQQGVALCAERSYSSDLDTAYEWMAKDRFLNQPDRHEEISWFDVSTNRANNGNADGVGIKRMPLYPLGAVYIPHSEGNYIIINIESKNVKMAMDLANGKWENSLFCASLRARDTNRVASVGTVMQLVGIDDRSIRGARTWRGNELPALNRVVVKCRAVGVADVVSIEEYDYKEDDYLVANVRVLNKSREIFVDGAQTAKTANTGSFELEAQQVIDDYRRVRSIYINSQSLASNELPKFARDAMQTLPTFDTDTIHDPLKFWKLVETWQMLCNTIRQSKQTQLQSIVNELSVSAAMQIEGPLELPVKRKSLPFAIQRQLEGMEQSASCDFMELGMDPVLDFQEILSMEDHWDRVKKLALMVKRERSRLEAKESLINAFLGKGSGEEVLTANFNNTQQAFD